MTAAITEKALTLGTDPELFLVHGTTGRPVPAHRFFPGKDAKRDAGVAGTKVFRDGYAVELNLTPQACRETLTHNFYYVIAALSKELAQAGVRLAALPAVEIDLDSDMRDAPEDVQHFGCDPAWDAYTGMPGTIPLDAMTHPYRYAGGHMHLGAPYHMWFHNTEDKPYWAEYKTLFQERYNWMRNAEQVALFMRMADLYVGVPLSYWFHKPETFARRQYYGRAGEFRFQEYGTNQETGKPLAIGVEYRVPGPEVWNAPPVASFAFGVLRTLAFRFNEFAAKWDAKIEPDVQGAINGGEGLRSLVRPMEGWYEKNLFDTGGALEHRPFQNLVVRDQETMGYFHTRGWAFFAQSRFKVDTILA